MSPTEKLAFVFWEWSSTNRRSSNNAIWTSAALALMISSFSKNYLFRSIGPKTRFDIIQTTGSVETTLRKRKHDGAIGQGPDCTAKREPSVFRGGYRNDGPEYPVFSGNRCLRHWARRNGEPGQMGHSRQQPRIRVDETGHEAGRLLLLLVAVLAQSFFALVGRDFVALTLFSARHGGKIKRLEKMIDLIREGKIAQFSLRYSSSVCWRASLA